MTAAPPPRAVDLGHVLVHSAQPSTTALFCTRPKGHSGQHVACGTHEVLEVWPS